MKPVIGLSASHIEKSTSQFGNRYVDYIQKDYVKALEKLGALVIILPVTNPSAANEYAQKIDGLVLAGGDDVSPLLYQEDPIKENGSNSIARDNFEKAMIESMKQQSKPILGVCRGLQIINATLGGANYQDINSQYKNVLGHNQYPTEWSTLTHSIKVNEDSFLSKAWGTEGLVNSFHHQAVKRIADGFEATAFASDQIIEAIENKKYNIYGVQFHPEMLFDTNQHAKQLFRNFVEIVKK
ncbi:gamma-glutamyl-gamma-aminobutyrate hydrolase family protein [Lactobacillus sp. S2-2]|uniref:gamma-glutamyl-gamma-aminobutyrate hydrolase family protein n=1 Tax=Lactobacillus sp. S2-2 TaxID=2692917 RepID=UPI001F1FEE2E|nr:gamma-glutamyl-gamma-aminobutyrate hydrolase family protein [Lactobacillus sp. S2-2]MCF6515402.1 gamma-glutamyl-gamma-aminobutyrate hydrolase family protein [Lactobacillus sp. S2-2]